MFDSERNKQHQRVLCNEIRRIPNETIKQLAVRIETLVRKAYSLNTHDYKNTKMTEILMMTLTPQLRKIAIKKRASHPTSFREPDLDFRKLVDKLEQAEITMKLEETKNPKLQYVNRIETNTTHINNVQESDTDLIEKITETLNIYERNPNFKGKLSFKKWCNCCRRYGHSIAECRQKQQDNQNKPRKHKEPSKSFYQYMIKDQNLPNKNIYSNNSSGNHFQATQNYSKIQSPYNSSYIGRSPERRNSRNFSQNRHRRSNSQNNQNNLSRSNSNTTELVSASSSHSNPRNRHYSNNRSRNSSYKRNRNNYSHNRNRSYSNNPNQNYSNNRSRNTSFKKSNYHRPIDNYQNRSQNNSQNRNSSYNNRKRNYSQSPHRNNNRYPDSKNRYRSNTPKHQRHINQVQANEETTSDPPGFDDTGSNELQLNHINCESSDTESDTGNTISVNLITVENDYEPIIYEQPFTSHIYENKLELLHNYYIGPINNNTRTTQEVNEINTKTKNTAKTFFQRLNKEPPFFSKFYPIYNQKRKHLKLLSGNIYNFSIKQVHQYDKSQNKQQIFMSDFKFKSIHKLFKITISSIKYSKSTNSDIISLHVYNKTPYQITLPLGLLGYCKTNATISPIIEVAYRVNNILQLLDVCQSTILNEELSINNIISNEQRNTDYFTKTTYFKSTYNITNYTKEQQKFLTMFNFQHSQITQNEFDKLAK